MNLISGRNWLVIRLAGLSMLVAAMAISARASAAPIRVTSTCTLMEAVQSANTNTAVHGCAAGSPGSDVISLEGTATLTAPLQITEAVEIRGGKGAVIVGGNNSGPTIPGMTINDCGGFPAAIYVLAPEADVVQLTTLTLRSAIQKSVSPSRLATVTA